MILATAVSIGLVVAVVAVQLLVPGGWGDAARVVLVVGLLIGLPHGAVDHVVPALVTGQRAPRLPLLVAGYAATAALAWAGFQAVPAVALVLFVFVSAAHFGAGEVAFDDERAQRPRRRDPVGVAAIGGAVLVLPIVGDPASVAPVIAALVPGSSGLLPPMLVKTAGAAVLAVVVLACLRHVHRGRWLAAVETALLTCLGLLVPPFAAFGVYFGGWHAVRHVTRIVAHDPVNAADLARGRVLRPIARFTTSAAAPTAASLMALFALWSQVDGWRGFLKADLALLAGLTVPHALVVAWWDHQTPVPHDEASGGAPLTPRTGSDVMTLH